MFSKYNNFIYDLVNKIHTSSVQLTNHNKKEQLMSLLQYIASFFHLLYLIVTPEKYANGDFVLLH